MNKKEPKRSRLIFFFYGFSHKFFIHRRLRTLRPLAEACDLAGVENMMLQLMIDPDFVNRLMDKCMITAKAFAKAQIEAGCEIIGMGDAVCSQIDLDTYNFFVRDRHQEKIDYIHGTGWQN